MRFLHTLARLNGFLVVPARLKTVNYRAAFKHSIQTGLMTGLGDIVAQHFVEGGSWQEHDMHRTLRLTSVGFFVVGPIFHVWYDMFLSKLYVQRTLLVATKKVVLDQGVFAPTFLILFYAAIGLFERSPVEKSINRIKHEFVPNMVVNYFIWPALQMLNFYYIQKPKYNILLVNTASIFWNSFLSWAAHKRIHNSVKYNSERQIVSADETDEKESIKIE